MRKKLLPQGDLAGRGCHKDELRYTIPDVPVRRNHHDLFFVLPDFVQCLCNQSYWGKCILAKALGPAVCQRVRAEGGLGQEIPPRAMGGFLGSKQVYLHFTESTQNQLDHLGMDSPLPLKC